MQSSNNVTIGVSANTAEVRANLAVAESALRDFERQLQRSAREARKAGDDLGSVVEKAAQLERQKTVVDGLRSSMENAARASGTMATGYHSAAGAAQQLSFQVNDLITQIGSGTSVQQAFMQQGGQIFQVFQTNAGAAQLLRNAISALTSPLGLAAIATATLAGGLLLLKSNADAAREALRAVYNEALAGGRDPKVAAENAKRLGEILSPKSNIPGVLGIRAPIMGRSEAAPIVAAIEAIPKASEDAKRSLAEVADAWRQIQFGGDAEKMAEGLRKLFGSDSALKELIQGAGKTPGTRLEEEAIGVLAERFGPAAAQLRERQGVSWGSWLSGKFDYRARPGLPFPNSGAAPPVHIPTQEEIERNKIIDDGNKLLDERKKKVEELAKIGAAANERERNAVKTLEQEIRDIDDKIKKKDEGPKAKSIIDRLEADLQARQTGIFENAAGKGPISSARALELIAQYESKNRPLIGWGETDLSGYPLSATGFPAWPGKMGPAGMSTAAGLYQITRSTWDPIAKRAGISDFGQGSQTRVAEELYRTRGFQPWASNPALRTAISAEGGAGGADAARTEALRAAVDFWTTQKAVAGRSADDVEKIEEKLQAARKALAEATLRDQERTASEATRAAEKAAREQEQARKKAQDDFLNQIREEEKLRQEQLQQIRAIQAEIGRRVSQWAAPFRSAFNGIEGSISSGLSGIITGQQTPGKALQNIGTRAVDGLTDAVTNTLSKVAAKGLGGQPGDTVGDVAGRWIGEKLFGMLDLGETANTTALTLNTAALGLNTAALGGSAAITGTAAATSGLSAAGSVGGILGGLSWAAGIFKGGGIVPSAAGGWSLPSFAGAQPALLHAREMVLPEKISTGIQNAIGNGSFGGGNTYNNFNIKTLTPGDSVKAVNRALRLGGGQLRPA